MANWREVTEKLRTYNPGPVSAILPSQGGEPAYEWGQHRGKENRNEEKISS